jgi:hypothetical protein
MQASFVLRIDEATVWVLFFCNTGSQLGLLSGKGKYHFDSTEVPLQVSSGYCPCAEAWTVDGGHSVVLLNDASQAMFRVLGCW